MANSFEAFSIVLKTFGCTNPNSLTYDSEAEVDNGTCVDEAFTECVKEAILSSKLDASEETKKNILIYTAYKALEESLKEGNKVKIEMYKEKLADLCNCKTC